MRSESDLEKLRHYKTPSFIAPAAQAYVVGWFDEDLERGALSLGDHSAEFKKNAEAVAVRLGIIRDASEGPDQYPEFGDSEAIQLEPRDARHLLAFHYKDPFPDRGIVRFGTADVLIAFDRLPSPLVPACRKIVLEVVWKNSSLDEGVFADDQFPERLERSLISKVHSLFGDDAIPNVLPERQPDTNITVIHLKVQLPPSVLQTDTILAKMEPLLEERFAELTSSLEVLLSGWEIATHWYWKTRHNVDLDPPPEGTGKIHFWFYDKNGELDAIGNATAGVRRVTNEERGSLECPASFGEITYPDDGSGLSLIVARKPPTERT